MYFVFYRQGFSSGGGVAVSDNHRHHLFPFLLRLGGPGWIRTNTHSRTGCAYRGFSQFAYRPILLCQCWTIDTAAVFPAVIGAFCLSFQTVNIVRRSADEQKGSFRAYAIPGGGIGRTRTCYPLSGLRLFPSMDRPVPSSLPLYLLSYCPILCSHPAV